MNRQFIVRPYVPADLHAVWALENRVDPYEPEDEEEVREMRARALDARARGDGWVPHVPEPDTTEDIARWYDGFWVAVQGEDVVGMVGVRCRFQPGAAPPRDIWHERDDVAELRRLRVAPEARRTGIGSTLTEAVIRWCRDNAVSTLYLHTTSPQRAARALYDALGFTDIGHVLTGEYEYVWYSMDLRGART